jgi:hypothetical protein
MMTPTNNNREHNNRELTDSELDLVSGGTSNNVNTFVAAVQSLTNVALDATRYGFLENMAATQGNAAV